MSATSVSPRLLLLAAALASAILSGCTTIGASVRLQEDVGPKVLEIPGLLACADGAQDVTLDPSKPVHLLVHGCNSSAARFKTLAKVFEASGQQTVCYSYDDRARLEDSSGGLARAITALKPHLKTRELVVLGHSQGGLVVRRALVDEQRDRVADDDFTIRLVTISSPFDGIQSSRHCSYLALHVVSFGLTSGICQLIAGIKWLDIHPRARMIRLPGQLVPTVTQHLKIVTDEAGACLRGPDGKCNKSDFVFTVEEQNQQVVDADPRMAGRKVAAGHVEIVGETGEAPVKLIKLLQDDGVLATPPAGQEQAFADLVKRLYDEPE